MGDEEGVGFGFGEAVKRKGGGGGWKVFGQLVC